MRVIVKAKCRVKATTLLSNICIEQPVSSSADYPTSLTSFASATSALGHLGDLPPEDMSGFRGAESSLNLPFYRVGEVGGRRQQTSCKEKANVSGF